MNPRNVHNDQRAPSPTMETSISQHAEEAPQPFQSMKGLHSEVFESATIRCLDPLRCISIRKLRTTSVCLWGIRMIKETILGDSNPGSLIRGFISTGKFSVLVCIPEEFVDLITEHFMEEGKSREVATALARSGPWYHVVDGGHLHAALVELIEEYSDIFGGFQWPVAEIVWVSPDTIRAISRMCHEMQRETHLIDFTLPDAMQNLRDIIDTQCRRQGITLVPGQRVRNGFIKEVMAIYSGRPGFGDSTMRNVCGIFVKLSSEVVHAVRLLLTEECEEYSKQLGEKSPFGRDTRVYKKLLSSQSLKGVKPFLDGSMKDEDRINVIHRLRFLARERESFKSFSAAEVEKQCQCMIDASREVSKFEDFLGEEGWPKDMENLKCNMLRTTLLDRDINEHIGAGNQLLPAAIDAYIKATGAHGSQKLGLFRRRMAAEETGTLNQDGEKESELPSTVTDEDQPGQEKQAEAGDRGTSSKDNNDFEDPDKLLKDCGVFIHRRTLLDFERNSDNVERCFDFIISDPFQKVPADDREDIEGKLDDLVDEKGVTIYLQCLRRLLVPGGYCIVFLDWNHMHMWASCCAQTQFETICDPFLVIKDAKRVQKMTMKGLQTLYDPALVIRKPGRHPSGFTLDKTSPYHHLPACTMPRWSNVIDGVPSPAERLTFRPLRAHVRPTEKPCSLFIELFQTFCPENGMVLDPRGGALTTGLATIATNRTCVLLETDERCLSFALPRLRNFAEAELSRTGTDSALMTGSSDKVPEDLQRVENPRKSDRSGASSIKTNDLTNNAASKAMEANQIDEYRTDTRLRGSGSFSLVTSEEGSPSHREGVESLEDEQENKDSASERQTGQIAVLKRSRFRRMSSESQQCDRSPNSFRRSKRGRLQESAEIRLC